MAVLPHADAAERLRRAHAGRRVLVVDDHPVQRAIATELLRGPGIVVHTVDDGEAALRAARDGAFDLVLMDVRMPGMDGLAATRALRAAGVATPIVAMTGDARPPDRAACLAAGMNDVLAKPVQPRLLYEALLAWLPPAPLPDGTALMARLRAVDGIDAPHALASVGGDTIALARVLTRVADTYGAGVPELDPPPAAGPRRDRRRAVHTLRGVAATLGAIPLLGTLEAYEAADDAGQGEATLDDLARAAQAELRALVGALQGALQAG